MGSITRHGKVHNWHFSPWISQAINTLRVKLGRDPIKNYFGNRIELARKYEMQPLDYATSNISVGVTRSRKSLFDLCILPVVKLPYIDYSGKQFLYRFLSHCQGTAFAVTAVHTKEETELFDNLLVSQRDLITSENSSNIMFNIFAGLWSSYCQAGNSIYYKTEEHLYAYYNILEDRKKYGNTVLMNIDISQFVRSATQNPARCYDCLRVSAIVQPLQPSSVVITQMFDRQRNLAYTPTSPNCNQTTYNCCKNSLPDLSTLSPVLDATPAQKRRREMCKVCNQSDCGGRSKRILCTNKCGKCQRCGDPPTVVINHTIKQY
ncbi:hypothetical protein INT47_005864 [Mucor saturninus]|uniref:PiggyBac transposable element-derived protein domain-containing protein n=1 Tax=Mucor saturninus TaxID=64648 RepID=A0A8H7QHF6_9FUNG|nr:hypothetical protein INT47_005864 [Mucor saturninus]